MMAGAQRQMAEILAIAWFHAPGENDEKPIPLCGNLFDRGVEYAMDAFPKHIRELFIFADGPVGRIFVDRQEVIQQMIYLRLAEQIQEYLALSAGERVVDYLMKQHQCSGDEATRWGEMLFAGLRRAEDADYRRIRVRLVHV